MLAADVPLWRGSLLPLACVAGPSFGAASRPSGSKLPRHKSKGCDQSHGFSVNSVEVVYV
ncbi:hypothetical protein QCBJ_12160 [Pseudomonas sp. QC2]|nr:hypothetical protein QCBJ_12160 [Pseudomonas sp. QC2]